MARRHGSDFDWIRNSFANSFAPKRRSRSSILGNIINAVGFLILASLCLFPLIFNIALDNFGYFAALLIIVFAIYAWRKSICKRRLDVILNIQMKNYQSSLLSYYRTSIYTDDFGNVYKEKWEKHVDTFLKTKIVPGVGNFQKWKASASGQRAAYLVDQFTSQKDEEQRLNKPHLAIEARDLTPAKYEQHCADILSHLGWNVRVTQASRDHGADVVAEKYGHRLVLQCKRYAQPVGNKAVQEVHSALHLYDGTIGCVIAPAGFTAQAKREANGLRVQLLHHSELEALNDRLQSVATQAWGTASPAECPHPKV